MRLRGSVFALLLVAALVRVLPAAVARAEGPSLPALPSLPAAAPIAPVEPAGVGAGGNATGDAAGADGRSGAATTVVSAALPVASAAASTSSAASAAAGATVASTISAIAGAIAPVASSIVVPMNTAPAGVLPISLPGSLGAVAAPVLATVRQPAAPAVAVVGPLLLSTLPTVPPALANVAGAAQQVVTELPVVVPVADSAASLLQSIVAPSVPGRPGEAAGHAQPATRAVPGTHTAATLPPRASVLPARTEPVAAHEAGAAPTISAAPYLVTVFESRDSVTAADAGQPGTVQAAHEPSTTLPASPAFALEIVADRVFAAAQVDGTSAGLIQPRASEESSGMNAPASRPTMAAPAQAADGSSLVSETMTAVDRAGASFFTAAVEPSLGAATWRSDETTGSSHGQQSSPAEPGAAGSASGHGGPAFALLIAALIILAALARQISVRWAFRGPASLTFTPVPFPA